ncbi:MAG: hypothetical protein Q9190_005145 [Brigantiaea leucoxantha]
MPASIALHHKIHREAQLPSTPPHIRLAVRPLHNLRIKRHNGHIVAPAHQLLVLPRPAIGLRLENLHHVFLGVRGGVGASVAVGGDVQRFVVVQELEHVGWWRGVDDGGGDELVHCLVVGRFGRVVHEAGAAAVDGAGEEGHSQGFLMGDALEGAD